MEDETRDDELRARINEYEACEGYKIQDELRAFRTGYDIFIGNHGDLKRALKRARDPQVWPHLWDERHRYRLVKFNREIARLLHNYVAAAKSLVEHTRNHMKARYAGTDFRNEYQARINADFKYDPLSQFLEDLRNYMLHKSLFAASLSLISDQGGLATQSYVALVPDKLREWKKWSKEGRLYLDGLDDQKNLEEVIDSYKNKVMKLWMWFGPRLGQEHLDAYRVMARLEDRIREVDPNWESGYGGVFTMKSSGP